MSRYDKYLETPAPTAQASRYDKYTTVSKQKEGFATRVKNDYEKRIGGGQLAAEAYVSGKQSLPETVVQHALNMGAGLGSDVIGEGLVSAGRVINAITLGQAGKAGSYVLDSVANSKMGDIASSAIGAYGGFKESHPRAGRNIDAAGNLLGIATSLTPVKGVSAMGAAEKALTPVVKGGGKLALKGAGAGFNKLNTKTILPGAEDVKKKSQSLYTLAREKGATFTDDVSDEIEKTVQSLRVIDPYAKNALGPDEMDAIAKRLSKAKNHTMTLDSFEALDKEWGALGHQAFNTGNDSLARKYDILQSKLREAVTNDKYISGSDDGVKAYRDATMLWANRSKMRDVDQVLENSKYYVGGEAAGLKAGFTRLAKSNRISKFSPKEAKLIQKAAQTGNIEGLMRTLGSRLMVIGGAIKGGPAGAAAGYAASQGMRGGAAALKGAEATKIGRVIAKEAVKISPDLAKKGQRIPIDKMREIMLLPPAQAKAALAEMKQKPQLLLPAPQKEFAVSPTGGVRPRSMDEVAQSNQARQRSSELGLTPDVRKNLSRIEIREKVGSAWDKITSEQRKTIASQADEAWKQNSSPLEEIIKSAKANAEKLASETGESVKTGSLAEALKAAKPIKRK